MVMVHALQCLYWYGSTLHGPKTNQICKREVSFVEFVCNEWFFYYYSLEVFLMQSEIQGYAQQSFYWIDTLYTDRKLTIFLKAIIDLIPSVMTGFLIISIWRYFLGKAKCKPLIAKWCTFSVSHAQEYAQQSFYWYRYTPHRPKTNYIFKREVKFHFILIS